MIREDLRNVAIIAHVDHGKTTLVDCLLRQTGTFRANQEMVERVMDSGDLERERGITILAKNTAVRYRDVKINIVDTPGHADFGGEVERVLSMVDGVLLVVDAVEGPMPQTRFVLQKALELRLIPIVVINKVDRHEARTGLVLDQVFDLMIELGADDHQADFTTIYTSAKLGYARLDPSHDGTDVMPLLDAILERIPPPEGDRDAPLQLQVNTLGYDDYVGRLAIGRVRRGVLKPGMDVVVVGVEHEKPERGRIRRLSVFEGLHQVEATEAAVGDLVAVAGIETVEIGDTIADAEHPDALPRISIEPPTLSMNFMVNDSPFAGQAGKFVTSRHILERLERELRVNPSLRVEPTERPDTFKVSGRGELHLAILVETMRREGYEFALSSPRVITHEENHVVFEPVELLAIDCEEVHMGTVIEQLGKRRAEMQHLETMGGGRVRLVFHVPTRGLLGFRQEFLTDTRGTGVMSHVFFDYAPWKGEIARRSRGSMIVKEDGETTAFALAALEERSELFIGPTTRVYAGQVVGCNARENDLVVNPCKKKHLTNMRSSTSDIAVRLTPYTEQTFEQSIEFIEDDELVEVTPAAIRLRKRVLDHSARKVLK